MADVNVLKKIISNVEKVIIGKSEVIHQAVLTLICDGHILIEDVPGVGKTGLATAVARSVNGSFKRIQFTPDVLPTDITGFSMYNQKSGEFEFRMGAIMSQFILADEINRTSPKTQASLLEAMEENQVSVDGKTYLLNKPFMVLATQNPIEYIGTYPLPEAQIDRFFIKASIGYPTMGEEVNILSRYQTANPIDTLDTVATTDDIIDIQEQVRNVFVDLSLKSYIVEIINKTRKHPDVLLGASIRGSLSLLRAAQGFAYMEGRNYVVPDDIKKMILPVLSHRVIIKQESKLKQVTPQMVLNSILPEVKVPKL